MKKSILLIFLFLPVILHAQLCKLEGKISVRSADYVDDTTKLLHLQISFTNRYLGVVYVFCDTNHFNLHGNAEKGRLVQTLSNGCHDTSDFRSKWPYGIEFSLVDSAGNHVVYNPGITLMQLFEGKVPLGYPYDENPPEIADEVTIFRTLGMGYKTDRIYKPEVWSTFGTYLRVIPILPLHTYTVNYTLNLKIVSKNIKPGTKYYLHAFYNTDTVCEYLNKYLKYHMDVEVLSIDYKFEPVPFVLKPVK